MQYCFSFQLSCSRGTNLPVFSIDPITKRLEWFSNGVRDPSQSLKALLVSPEPSTVSHGQLNFFFINAGSCTRLNRPKHVHRASRVDYSSMVSFKGGSHTFSFIHLPFCHCNRPITPSLWCAGSPITSADPEGSSKHEWLRTIGLEDED